MKTFGIYFSAPGALDYPLNKKVFFEAYAEIIEVLEEKGINAVIVRNNSYLGNGNFSHYFKWDSKTFIRVDKEVKVDLLWNRDSENVIPKIEDLEILNRFEFDEICRDKITTAEKFGEFGADTFLLNSFKDLEKNIGKIKTTKIVLKPRFGEQCQGIYVIDKNEIKPELYENWKDVLLQEFLDSSIGIENMVNGLHEIQVFIVNGEFSGARIKQPAKGSYISSATGSNIGTVKGLTREEVPLDLMNTITSLDEKMKKYPLRLYRADFVNTKDGYKMIEINSRPGVMHKDKEGELYWDFNGRVIELVVNFLK